MRRSPREWLFYFLSILFAAIPFAFGLIRAVSTGYDVRYLWMALASLLGAVIAGRTASTRKPIGVLALSAPVLIVATVVAGLAAFLLGARSVAAAGIVALAFGFCWAASYALYALSRPRIV
jgi:CHASE2 domain-containing sensor protein